MWRSSRRLAFVRRQSSCRRCLVGAVRPPFGGATTTTMTMTTTTTTGLMNQHQWGARWISGTNAPPAISVDAAKDHNDDDDNDNDKDEYEHEYEHEHDDEEGKNEEGKNAGSSSSSSLWVENDAASSSVPKRRRWIHWPSSQAVLERRTGQLLHEVAVGQMNFDDVRSARGCLGTWARKGTRKGAQQAEAMLERLVQEVDEEDSVANKFGTSGSTTEDERGVAAVRTASYNFVMRAWAASGASDAPHRAEALLKRMEERHHHVSKTFHHPAPDTDSYNALLTAWAYASGDLVRATRRVEEILEWLEGSSSRSESDKASLSRPRPNRRTYNIVINRYANNWGDVTAAGKAEDMLFRLSAKSSQQPNQLAEDTDAVESPDLYTFNTVLKAWLNSTGGMESAKRADDILGLLKRLAQQTTHANLRPDVVTYNTIIRCYADAGGIPASDRAHQLLEELLEELLRQDQDSAKEKEGRTDVLIPFQNVMTALARSGHANAGERAEALLDQLLHLEQESPHFCGAPTVDTFVHLLDAWGKSTVPEAPQKVLEWFHRMRNGESIGEGGWYQLPPPSTLICNVTLHALNRHRRRGSVPQVEEIFHLMLENPTAMGDKEDKGNVSPDEVTYTAVLEAVCGAIGTDKSSADRAMELLSRMEQDVGVTSFYPYRLLLRKLARHHNQQALQLLQRLTNSTDLSRIQVPGVGAFLALLADFAKSHRGRVLAAQQSHQILHLMRKLEVPPNSKVFTRVLVAWSRVPTRQAAQQAMEVLQEMDQEPTATVDVLAVRTVLFALSKCGTEEAADKAAQLIEWAQREKGLCLDLTCHNVLLQAHAARGSQPGAQRATELYLDKVQRVEEEEEKKKKQDNPQKDENEDEERELDIISLNTCLVAWSKVKPDSDLDLAAVETLWNTLQRLDGILEPDTITVMATMQCLVKSKWNENAHVRASELMEFASTSKIDMDRGLYEEALACFANGRQPVKGRRCLDAMLQAHEQGNLAMKPSTLAYNMVLNCCGIGGWNSAEEKATALAIARQTFDEVCGDNHHKTAMANEMTHANMIRVCSQLATSSAHMEKELLPPVLESCRSKGLWGPMVQNEVGKLRLSMAAQEQLGLTGPQPPEWSQNARRLTRQPRGQQLH